MICAYRCLYENEQKIITTNCILSFMYVYNLLFTFANLFERCQLTFPLSNLKCISLEFE